jgi:hypothetical protein
MRDSSDANPYPFPDPENAQSVATTVTDTRSVGGHRPETLWATLAPLLAGRPRVRESRSNGHSYLRRWERPLTTRLPAVPAAVPIYSGAGDTRVLVIDLDSSRGGADAVRRDADTITALVHRAGGQVIRDESPSRGMHLYVPFTQPIGFHDARDLALALAARTPTMDPSPNQNLTEGLIRPPGSAHPSGGHQTLHGDLTAARHLAATGNPPAVLTALYDALSTELAAVRHHADHTTDLDGAPTGHLPRPGGPRELTPDYLRIATTGTYDTTRYRSPSEARQAVLDAAVWAGLTLPAVLARINNGTWPGLAAFYTRYRNPRTRRTALLADWRKATTWVSKQATATRQSLVRKSPTSQPPSHGGAPTDSSIDQHRRGTTAEYQWLRTWWTAMTLLERTRYTGRRSIGTRWVLRALGEAAMKNGSRYIAFGVRSLSIATGLDHTTVAAHLRTLRDEHDPLIDLIENDRGLAGDLYQLRIPDEIQNRATTISWRPGKLHALRPAFRELGHPAAITYEALEAQPDQPQRSFDLITATGLGRSTIHDALGTLAAWNLVRQHNGHWTLITGTDLRMLAEEFGCLDQVRAQINRHRDERAAYRHALRAVDRHPAATTRLDHHTRTWPDPEPPPEIETLLDLLERELGAHLIDA